MVIVACIFLPVLAPILTTWAGTLSLNSIDLQCPSVFHISEASQL